MIDVNKSNTMASGVNCGVCGRPLVYGTDSVERVCAICDKRGLTSIYCPEGHYICDTCHSKTALDVLRQVLSNTKETDPAAILEQVMAHPGVPMHGPEHHAMVPGAIIAAVRNAGYTIPPGAIERALERAAKVPGGSCGLYGDCGAAVGAGIAVSVLTSATPLTGKQRSLALGATAFALSRMLDDQPRCCKRATRTAIAAMVDYLHDHLNITLPKAKEYRCTYTPRNQQCTREQCQFYK